MGIGFVAVILGDIVGAASWKYAWLFPYAHPMLTLKLLPEHSHVVSATSGMSIDIFTKEIFVSLIISAAVFIGGYLIVLKKSVK